MYTFTFNVKIQRKTNERTSCYRERRLKKKSFTFCSDSIRNTTWYYRDFIHIYYLYTLNNIYTTGIWIGYFKLLIK